MKLKQAKIILEKINRLYQTMTLDEGQPDPFEVELMQSYIRQLYVAFSDTNKKKATVEIPIETPAPKPVVKPAPVAKKEPLVEPVAQPTVQPEVAKVVVPEPPKVEVPKVEEIKVAPPVEAPKPVAPKPKPTPVTATPVAKVSTEEEVELFDQKEATELSEKLSQAPVKDLMKAMGINERILTMNELFNGEQSVFEHTLKTLNGMATFEEAKAYLSTHIASRYEWTQKAKKSKAKRFIKLVRRRYS